MVMTQLLPSTILSRAPHAGATGISVHAVRELVEPFAVASAIASTQTATSMWTMTEGVYGEANGCAKWDSLNRKPSPPGFGVVT